MIDGLRELAVVTGYGGHDTHALILNDGRPNADVSAGTPYNVIRFPELIGLVEEPPSVPKERAQWIIPSSYVGPDARSHAAQRQHGVYRMLAADIDQGNPSLEQVVAAVERTLGPVFAVVYSTRSATADNRKWRVLVPLAEPLSGTEYAAYQAAWFDGLKKAGLAPDRSLDRPGQLVYLPNRGELYQWHVQTGALLDAKTHPMGTRAADYLAEEAEQEQAARHDYDDQLSFIAAFNRKHSIGEMLAAVGCEQSPHDPDLWRYSHQTTPGYGSIRIMRYPGGARWVSLSDTFNQLGIGKRSRASGGRNGDAYDLACHLSGNDKAFKYAIELWREENSYLIEHGRQVWEGLRHIGGAPKAALLGTTALFQFHRVMGSEETAVMEFYIDPWLPKGIVVGVYGRGESGKSSWISTMVAKASAQVSTLWISSEEDLNHIAVRYTKSGGQPDTLMPLSGTPTITDSDKVVVFDVYEHLERTIKDAIERQRPDRPLGIVVLDAIGALVTWPKGDNANDDGSVKRLLAHLHSLSGRYGVTIVIIGHMNKNPKTEHVADAVNGTLAWTSSTRRSFLFYKDKASESDYDFFVRTAKANLGTHFAASYQTVPVHTIHHREDAPSEVLCRIEFTSPIVWGERAISELINDSPEDDPNHKARATRKGRQAARLTCIVEAIKAGHTTRKAIEEYASTLDMKLQNRDFQNPALAAEHGVTGHPVKHGQLIYSLEMAPTARPPG